MNQSIKWTVGIIVVVVIVATGYFVTRGPDQVSTSTLKIGLILPLTGEIASLGENAKNGANLAYDELSENIKQKIQ